MAEPATLCPYYGKHAIQLAPGIAAHRGVLVRSGGNQCALVTDSYRPCYMQLAGQQPELEACEWNGSARAVEFLQFPTVALGDGTLTDERGQP